MIVGRTVLLFVLRRSSPAAGVGLNAFLIENSSVALGPNSSGAKTKAGLGKNGKRTAWTPFIQQAELWKVCSADEHSNMQQNEKERKRKQLTWEEKFAMLRQYKREHGNCNPPSNYVTQGVKLVSG